MKVLVDRFGRVHDYLRISVTDRCNLRCVYCMPEEGMEFEPADRILSYEEITEVVAAVAKLGVRKLRITGGEPLVRKEIEKLLAMLSAIPGIEDIALTTNAIFLAQKAEALRQAGVTRVNISLDSLRPERFALITRGGSLKRVLDGLEAALRVGFHPVKLNVVLMQGQNDDEIEDFIRLTLDKSLQVRFIEYMPIGHADDGWRAKYLSLETVFERVKQMGLTYEPAEDIYGNGPAENYRVPGAVGTFGLIHPVSDHFCGNCNRLRLTADGNIKPCLYWDDEWNVRPLIGNEAAIQDLFLRAIDAKPENHEMAQVLMKQEQSHKPTVRRMSQIGG
ncbi:MULTISPECIES: GTP 3',8-cyclase MoaA [Aneurinibacillus]|uniref:GTP 3',8-cyclase n=1 Tax=Aneurinibacillus thermoaerophilus TaxID=143495 RepID=A0A1G7WZD9_ANETH|nr:MULTISPECIES: GTP 3',8-cyclase MoaA [Aneurinibacillus]AMA73865.1 cyclic pyranopterin phosphate synthase MoaA [Aneurinibacillus sp. XH2]MED0674041.1 GTP 3',8-cyclase MoaA [Aneurinibacillus thermoaerophilus]MED0737782.1 GTP 3',8-cyclase MoaA [Aneurinibacillus thermoaerophilus]MED0755770.1 GTP 3',8-cyclase MoaA [Aneurinibacillus thermoaerophilus]MED0759901.1 GTP 3',8-cyclase MoaA [Aneurinibacillus thermoaerophilus]